MERNCVMTALWSRSGEIFEKVAFGNRKNFKNFNELVFNLHLPANSIYSTLEKICLRRDVVDSSDEVLKIEAEALLDPSYATALEIVKRHLDEINLGNKECNLWCYLDEAKRACVHFIKKKGWYAEIYILSENEFSAIHIVEDGKYFIPVLFSKDITKEFKKVSVSGGKFLQEYPLRVSDGILGRRSITWLEGNNQSDNAPSKARFTKIPRDHKDSL